MRKEEIGRVDLVIAEPNFNTFWHVPDPEKVHEQAPRLLEFGVERMPTEMMVIRNCKLIASADRVVEWFLHGRSEAALLETKTCGCYTLKKRRRGSHELGLDQSATHVDEMS